MFDGAYLTGRYLSPINVHLSDTVFYVNYPPIIEISGYTASVQVNKLAGGAAAPSFLQALSPSNRFEITMGLLNFALLGTYDFQLSLYIILSNGTKLFNS